MVGIQKKLLVEGESYKEQILKCLNYLEKNNGLDQIEDGRYIIEDDNIFVNIMEYETREESGAYWEAHKKYLDLHFIIRGMEKICVGNLFKMNYIDYNAEKDFVQVEGDGYAEICLEKGDFLLLEPCDAHKTGICGGSRQKVKKAVFKIKIAED